MGYKTSDVFKNNSLYERVNKLLVSYEWSDCSFVVCGKRFKAHKLILGISSPVFEAMFYGPLASNDEITITDIESNTFQHLLNYIYTDKVNLNSIEQAYELLYVSRKYMLEYLSEMCITYIQSSISIDNVITILDYPDYVQNNQLILSALKLTCQHASFLLNDQKQHISLTCMKKVLESNEINISEKDLIKSVFEWTLYYCDQNDIPRSLENRRDVLINKGLFKLLRFHILSLAEFDEIISDQNNLISKSEADDIICVIQSNSEKRNTNEVSKIRNTLELNWSLCLRSPIRSESPVVIGAQNHIIFSKIKANKSVFIKSLNVQSRTAPVVSFSNADNVPNIYCEQLLISITCEADNSIIKIGNFIKTLRYDTNFDIDFPKPVLLKKDVWYKVCFQWPKSPKMYAYTNYAVQSRDRCYNNGKIQFDFEDILPLSDTGSFLRGLKFCM